MMGGTVKNQQGLQGARRLIVCQLSVTFVLAAIALAYAGVTSGRSALLGGLVSILPNAYFAHKLFRYQGAQAAKRIVNSFYKGEALKLVLTIVLFTLVFKFITINPLVFFAAYIVVQMLIYFAPLIFVNKGTRLK